MSMREHEGDFMNLSVVKSSVSSVGAAALLEKHAREHSGETFVTFLASGEAFSSSELLANARAVAGSLFARGISKGDRVALLMENSREFLELWSACHLLGVIAVPLNTALRGESLTHPLRSTAPRIIVCIADLQVTVEAAAELAGLHDVEILSVQRHDSDGAFAALRKGQQAPVVQMREDEPCCILFTSGTTGPSKGVTCTPGFTHHTAAVVAENMKYGSDDILYITLPMFHGNALHAALVPALYSGASVAIAERFSASKFWDEVRESQATSTNMLGAMLPIMLKQRHPGERSHRLTKALVIPLTQEHAQEIEDRFGVKAVNAYGQGDLGMTLWNSLSAPKPGSAGQVTHGYELRVVDETDRDVEAGEVGELVARPTKSNILPLGYWGQHEETLKAWRNLWFHTGDLFRMDFDGWYYFIDRKKDIIRRRGENISSYEVETAVADHPAVAEVAAYPVSSELSEDEVAVGVVLADGESLDPLDLVKFVEMRLPYFAVPRYVRILEALPKTQTAKIQKVALRNDGVTSDTWDRERSEYVVQR